VIRFSFKLYVIEFFIALFTNQLGDYINFAVKKICPTCGTKMHKNALHSYNCGKCFERYCKKMGI